MSPPDPLTEYERGIREGRVDALLEEHTKRLNKINGSVERFSKSNEDLAKVMHAGLERLSGEIRTLQEAGRIAEARVKATAETLAAETERKRLELEAATDASRWRFTRGHAVVALVVSAGLSLLGLYLIQ